MLKLEELNKAQREADEAAIRALEDYLYLNYLRKQLNEQELKTNLSHEIFCQLKSKYLHMKWIYRDQKKQRIISNRTKND